MRPFYSPKQGGMHEVWWGDVPSLSSKNKGYHGHTQPEQGKCVRLLEKPLRETECNLQYGTFIL